MPTPTYQERSPGNLASEAFASADSPQKDFYQSAVHTITEALQGSALKGVHRLLISPLCSFLHLRTLDAIYQRVKESSDPFTFAQNILDTLNIYYQITPPSPNKLPVDGPLIIVANHPFGGLEALIICSIFKNIRQDVRFIANPYLQAIPLFRELLIPIDPFNHPDSKHINLRGLRQAKKWVQNGGALCLFPAGEVSHWHVRKGKITDPAWKETAAKLIINSKADFLPVYFHGANSLLFQYAGLLHSTLRTLLLPSEVLKKRNQQIQVHIRTPIQGKLMTHLTSKQAATWYLRARTYGSDKVSEPFSGFRKLSAGLKLPQNKETGIAPALPLHLYLQDLDRLPQECILLQNSSYVVVEATSRQIPHLLHEIGRQREITFRHNGEGSQKPLDLDLFDHMYDHLILWNTAKQELAGAYRLGRTDVLLSRPGGKKNLYTSTLFRFRPAFFRQMRGSLELGRSFIVPAYQKDYFPLLLLWKGIGQFVQKRPHYRFLFGPVSISQDYDSLSIKSLITHLRSYFYQPDLCGHVRGKKQPKLKCSQFERLLIECIGNLKTSDLDSFIVDIQDGSKGIPVLLRQYLKLGGKIADFHHDHKFGSYDGLIVVDLLQTQPHILSKFMGQAGASDYLNHHKLSKQPTSISA
ncbi:MAG: lysophospholipid acyltransferase family protein [Thermodesulfobacteriota bacterium]